MKLFDIAANLSDDRFKGVYYGKKVHDEDFNVVIKRAYNYGVKGFLFASGYLEDYKESYDLSLMHRSFFCTIGVHPCRANEVFKGGEVSDAQQKSYFDKIKETLDTCGKPEKVIAIGECGLDYDRLDYADKET